MNFSTSLLITILVAGTLSACSNRDSHDHPELKSGEALFNHHCAECHGKDGTGMLVDKTPANILTQKDAQGIVNYIRTQVREDRKMPLFNSMPAGEAALIANHLIRLKGTYAATPNELKKNPALMIRP